VYITIYKDLHDWFLSLASFTLATWIMQSKPPVKGIYICSSFCLVHLFQGYSHVLLFSFIKMSSVQMHLSWLSKLIIFHSTRNQLSIHLSGFILSQLALSTVLKDIICLLVNLRSIPRKRKLPEKLFCLCCHVTSFKKLPSK
jgi:hypothetical protein